LLDLSAGEKFVEQQASLAPPLAVAAVTGQPKAAQLPAGIVAVDDFDRAFLAPAGLDGCGCFTLAPFNCFSSISALSALLASANCDSITELLSFAEWAVVTRGQVG